jgi:hypothetical protein
MPEKGVTEKHTVWGVVRNDGKPSWTWAKGLGRPPWTQWVEHECRQNVDPRKWKQRAFTPVYLVTGAIDVVTLPIMAPFYVYSYIFVRGLSPM